LFSEQRTAELTDAISLHSYVSEDTDALINHFATGKNNSDEDVSVGTKASNVAAGRSGAGKRLRKVAAGRSGAGKRTRKVAAGRSGAGKRTRKVPVGKKARVVAASRSGAGKRTRKVPKLRGGASRSQLRSRVGVSTTGTVRRSRACVKTTLEKKEEYVNVFIKPEFKIMQIPEHILNKKTLLELNSIIENYFCNSPEIFHPLHDFKGKKVPIHEADRFTTTIYMNKHMDFASDTDQTRQIRCLFFSDIDKILGPWKGMMKYLYPHHECYIAILISYGNQKSFQKIHYDFDPTKEENKRKSDESFSTVFPTNGHCNINLMSNGCEVSSLAVNTGFMLKFTSQQAHGGGSNNCGAIQSRVHAYWCTSVDDVPNNVVYKVK
jgi:hypothetical protein